MKSANDSEDICLWLLNFYLTLSLMVETPLVVFKSESYITTPVSGGNTFKTTEGEVIVHYGPL